MRRSRLVGIAAAALALAAPALALATPAGADEPLATITAVHGIPGSDLL